MGWIARGMGAFCAPFRLATSFFLESDLTKEDTEVTEVSFMLFRAELVRPVPDFSEAEALLACLVLFSVASVVELFFLALASVSASHAFLPFAEAAARLLCHWAELVSPAI